MVLCAFIAALVAAGPVFSQETDSEVTPTLDHWISVFWNTEIRDGQDKAKDAVRTMGSKAAIEMAKWVKSRNPRAADYQTQLAMAGFFSALKDAAAPSVPILSAELTNNLLLTPLEKKRFEFTMTLLCMIGPRAAPAIEVVLSSMKQDGARAPLDTCVMTLAAIARDNDATVYARISSFLNAPHFAVRVAAATSLAMVAPPSDTVQDIIRQGLRSDESSIKVVTLVHFQSYKGDRASYIPYLIPSLQAPNLETRGLAARAIGYIGRAAFTAIKASIYSDNAAAADGRLSALSPYSRTVGPPAWPDVRPILESVLRGTNSNLFGGAINVAEVFSEQVKSDPELASLLAHLTNSPNADRRKGATRTRQSPWGSSEIGSLNNPAVTMICTFNFTERERGYH